MIEYLDIYDEEGNYLGKEDRKIVHKEALWHKTVHCWLYDKEGNIFFQIRKDEKKLYTTASGHIKAGETVKEGFGREIKEEIGTDIDFNQAELVTVVPFTLDKELKDGSIFKDRAFANVFVCIFDNNYNTFDFDEKEVEGVVKVNAKETLELFEGKKEAIKSLTIKKDNGKIKQEQTTTKIEDFLVNKGETIIGKYGDVLNKVIALTKK
jgi:isopentenyldiphosphate isomerase